MTMSYGTNDGPSYRDLEDVRSHADDIVQGLRWEVESLQNRVTEAERQINQLVSMNDELSNRIAELEEGNP